MKRCLALILILLSITINSSDNCLESGGTDAIENLSNLITYSEEICLNINLGNNISFDQQKVFALMNDCITKVFESSPLRVTLKGNCEGGNQVPSSWESSQNFGLYDPLINLDGSNVSYNSPGHTTNIFNLFVSNSVNRSNAKSYWPDSISSQERQDAITAGELDRACKDFYENVVNPYQSKSASELGISNDEFEARKKELFIENDEICTPSYVLIDKYPDRDLPIGNCAHIRPDTEEEMAKIIVHELMHLWGGLKDRYKGKPEQRARWSDNLMGNNASCNSLTQNQINSIIQFRLDGTEEVFIIE